MSSSSSAASPSPSRPLHHAVSPSKRRYCALILFKDRHLAWHVTHTVNWPEPGVMVPRLLDVAVADINFANLGPSWTGRSASRVRGYVVVVGLMVAWVPLVASTGALSQLDSFARFTDHARVILTWPPWVKGLVQGLAPQLAVRALLTLFPVLLRLVVQWQNFPTKVGEEIAFHRWLGRFQFLFLFFIVSISVAVMTVTAELVTSVNSIPFILARNLPKAATYFCSYLVTQTLVSCGMDLCQSGALLRQTLKAMPQRLRASIPETDSVPVIRWGAMYPDLEIMASIGKSPLDGDGLVEHTFRAGRRDRSLTHHHVTVLIMLR